MNPQLASLLTLGFIAAMFWRDSRKEQIATRAIWIPTLWLLINMSRYVSQWCGMYGIPIPGGSSYSGGSPVDAAIFFLLILSGFFVIARRNIGLGEIIGQNKLIFIFLAYCFLAIVWSEYPFVAFKRWIKVLGHPIIILVILSEPNPMGSLKVCLKRVSYIILPVSILFLKYYPGWGRGFSEWTGEAYNLGITTDKNALGVDCLILGFFYFWHLVHVLKWAKSKDRRDEILICLVFIAMIWWLLSIASSSTPLVCLIFSVVVSILLGFKWVKIRMLGTYLILCALAYIVGEEVFDIYTNFLIMLGKDPTLTERTILWATIFTVEIDPIFGAGFESFWLGERLEYMWSQHNFRPNQAHNGYLETYINLGIIGLALHILLLVNTFFKSKQTLSVDFEYGRLRFGLLVAMVFYNWTEATFKAVHPMYTIFYLIAIDYWRVLARKEKNVKS